MKAAFLVHYAKEEYGMKFRPCIDIHNGKVKQIVGSSLQDQGDQAKENFASTRGADFYARMYRELGQSGGHVIMLNPVESPYYERTKKQAIAALSATPGLLQIGGGISTARVESEGDDPVVIDFLNDARYKRICVVGNNESVFRYQ